ncbi:MAG TPA: bifunctional riboflavin kinase/FAD synthetase [Prolixibacteraceae bacterium]|nr:bifunctional riboflavin kinase/FAD synthetase [Prolixibacteraceae bacterium]
MIIHHNINNFSAAKPVITIGTFDGVHRGHHKVLEQLNSIANKINGESVIFTFYPHPRITLSNNHSDLRLITTLEEKAAQLEKAGIDHLVVFPFTREFASLHYDEFIKKILIDKLHLHTLVVGYDHKLGQNREGSFENIVNLSKILNFEVIQTETFDVHGINISSSIIRQALQEGDIKKANEYLGYTFSIKGIVAEGNRIGRSINYPTANIEATDSYKLIPAEGVYAITINIHNETHKAMLNIGFRPTIEQNADHRTIEAHIFNFSKNIYKQNVTIHFHDYIRKEMKFDSVEQLKAQLNNDKKTVEQRLQTFVDC